MFFLALKHRHTISLHAGYMLATPLILFESPFGRVIADFVPWLNIINSDGPRWALDTIVISNALAMLFALVLWARNRKHGAPWLVAAAFVGVQSVAMWFAPDMPLIGSAFAAYAAIPPAVTLVLAIGAGAATAWFGWEAGKPQRKAAVQPA